jgi:chromosome partitioning protein
MAQKRISVPIKKKISISDVVVQADRAVQMISDVRSSMLAPTDVKLAPVFSLTQVAALCGIEKGQLAYRLAKEELPAGQLNEKGSRREFSLSEARSWVRAIRSDSLKPDRQSGSNHRRRKL